MNRSYIKEKGKKAFTNNYWPCVLVAIILVIVTNISLIFGSGSNDDIDININNNNHQYELKEIIEKPINNLSTSVSSLIGLISIFALTSAIILVAIVVSIEAFLINVLVVGCKKFFLENSHGNGKLGQIFYGFKSSNYTNIVKVEFMKNLNIVLWSLLFIIPGIIKYYEYYYVTYLLCEDPSLNYKDALEKSRKMTMNYKFDIFVFQLSFIDWYILNIMTLGILGIFWTNPYIYASNAELYKVAKNSYSIE